MARTGNIVDQEIAPTVVQDAILQIMRSALGNRPLDMDMARDMAGRLTPAVQKMGFHGASSATLSGNAAFHSLVAQHLGSPAAAAAYDPAFRKQVQQAIDTANIHGPHYLGGVVDGIRLARAMVDARATDADGRRSGSSARFGEAGMAVPGNADARGFDIRNYYTSPVTRGLVDMGVTDGTYNFVRQHVPGVSTHSIRKAAQDAGAMGFDVNDQRMVKNHAIIRHKDKEADKTNKHLQDFGKALDESKEFREPEAAHGQRFPQAVNSASASTSWAANSLSLQKPPAWLPRSSGSMPRCARPKRLARARSLIPRPTPLPSSLASIPRVCAPALPGWWRSPSRPSAPSGYSPSPAVCLHPPFRRSVTLIATANGGWRQEARQTHRRAAGTC